MNYSAVLLFGAPGSGKGTQGRVLAQVPGLYYFACGDAFRSLRAEDPLGKVFIEYSSQGRLVPDDFTIELWKKNIHNSVVQGKFQPDHDTLILDGIPRNPHQVEIMSGLVNVKGLINLTCESEDQMINRIQRRALRENRLDDANLQVIRQRFLTYDQETKPVLACFDQSLIHNVDSTQPPLKVLADVLQVLAKIL